MTDISRLLRINELMTRCWWVCGVVFLYFALRFGPRGGHEPAQFLCIPGLGTTVLLILTVIEIGTGLATFIPFFTVRRWCLENNLQWDIEVKKLAFYRLSQVKHLLVGVCLAAFAELLHQLVCPL